MLNLFENKATLTVAYLVAVLLVVAIGILAAVRLHRISAAMDDLTNNLAADIALSKEIVNQVLLTRFYANKYVNTQDQTDLDHFNQAFAGLEELLLQASEQIADPERGEMIRRITLAVEAYGDAFGQVAELIRRRQRIQSEVLDVNGLQIDDRLTALRMHVISLDDPRAFLAVGNARNASQSMRLNAARYLDDGDERYAVLFEASRQQVQAALSTLEDVLDSSAQREDVAEGSAAVEAYGEGFRDIHTDYIEVQDIFETELDTLEPEIGNTASEIVTSVEQEFERQNAFSQRLIIQTRLVLVLTTAVAALASVSLGVVFSRRMAERERAEQALRKAYDRLEMRVQERTADLEQANEEMEERRMYLEGVLRAAPDAIITLNARHRIVEWNKGAENLFGYSEEEAVGKYVDDLVAALDVYQEAVSFTQMIMEGKELPPTETVRYRKDGSPVNVLVAASPIMLQDEFIGLVGVYTDITEQVRAEEQLERYAAELEQANEEIKQFAYIVSHDLRAPLVNLKGFSAELRFSLDDIRSSMDAALPHLDEGQQQTLRFALEEDVPEALNFIESSVTRMDKFITAVLFLSRLGRRELEPEPIDMESLVRDALESLTHQIEEREVAVTVGPLPDVVADRTSMEQIMGNLLDNALKYLQPDRPGEIEITGERNDETTTFRARDNGRGIAEDDMPKVFAPFRRAGRQERPGEGMGLPYVQTLVRRHGGLIWCESELGKGTTFTFTISNHLEEKEGSNVA